MKPLLKIVFFPIYLLYLLLGKIANKPLPPLPQRNRPRLTEGRKSYSSRRSFEIAFDCIHLVESTANLQTLDERLRLLHDCLAEVEYQYDVEESMQVLDKPVKREAIAVYQQYQPRPLTETQLRTVQNPTPVLDNWLNFHDYAYLGCIQRHIQSETEKIEALKTAKGKSNRYTNLLATVLAAQSQVTIPFVRNGMERLIKEIGEKAT